MKEKLMFLIDSFKFLDNHFVTLKFKLGFKESCNIKIKNKNVLNDYNISPDILKRDCEGC